jgi:transposase-like protein
MSAVRAVPFYCPFCGEQDIRPDDGGSASWRCESCERHFELTVTSIGAAHKQRSDSAPGGEH